MTPLNSSNPPRYVQTLNFQQQEELAVFQELCKNSEIFRQVHPAYTEYNLVKTLAVDINMQVAVAQDAKATYPIYDTTTLSLISDFLEYKREHGSSVERSLYASMNNQMFIERLLTKRPVVFMTADDIYRLRDGTQGVGRFDKIGTDEEKFPIHLCEYLSYEEMQISALLAIGGPVRFINNGVRDNRGDPDSNHVESGIYYGLVGPRFEKVGYMEYEHMVVYKYLNTKALGYGIDGDMDNPRNLPLKFWAKYYDVTYFPTFEEVEKKQEKNFIKIDSDTYLNVSVYKKRIKKVIAPFLEDADKRATGVHKKAYIHAVGLGLGVWCLTDRQGQLFVDAVCECLSERPFSAISDIDFSYFPEDCKVPDSFDLGIQLHFSKRNPADPISDNKVLIAMYPADSNSFVGNEYWLGAEYLAASGEPAAACSSTMAEMHNPEINQLLKNILIK